MNHLHATALLLGERGVLIQGTSGSGKSTLALALVHKSRLAGRFARIVSDDQLALRARDGRLIASAPQTISGLVEVHGLRPTPVCHESRAVIDLVVRLVDAKSAPRYQDGNLVLEGCLLPVLDLSSRNVEAAAIAIHAWLGFEPLAATNPADVSGRFSTTCASI